MRSPCTQVLGLDLSSRSAPPSAGASALATMTCLGETRSMQCASDGPVRLVLSSATAPPARVMPSQIARYSGRFGISRQTTSPWPRPCASAQRA